MVRFSSLGTRRLSAVCLMAISLALLTASVALGQDNGVPAVPPEVSDNADAWPLPNYDYANTRNATSTIDASNVNDLGVAWTFAIPGVSYFGSAATNPIIIDGVVYFEDLASNVYALDLNDGHIIWERDYSQQNIGPNGVAVGWGKVFAGVGSGGIAALDMETGEELWNVFLPVTEQEGMDIQPSVYDGMVYVSTVPGVDIGNFYAGGGVGYIHALNQETGEIVWTFRTVNTSDIWGNPDVNSGGGAWYPPAIDTDAGITYWSVANPAPWPGTEEFPNGSSRPGPNLYSNSLVSLDHATGAIHWYTQVKPHDLFDLDLQLSPILTTATVQGQDYDVVITSGKLGTVYAMDRISGNILWQTDVGEHQNDWVQEIPPDTTIKVLPGNLGGVETPMALGDDGILYVPLLNQPTYYTATGQADVESTDASTGNLVAIDVNTGAILWTQDFDNPNYGAATVVNDLVFTSTFDGMVHAFDRHTGEELWTWTAPTSINGWPAVAGDTILIPAGFGATPQLIALRLGAEGGPTVTAEATSQITDDPNAQLTATPAPETGETTGNEGTDDDTSVQAEQTALPETDDAEEPASPISQGDPEATNEAGMDDMDMEMTADAGTDGTTEQGTTDADTESLTGPDADLSQFISVDDASQTVNLTIEAGLGMVNANLNFNARARGDATVTVPEGYTVHVTFTNVGTLPHSAMVTPPEELENPIPTELAFEGASTPNPNNGTNPGDTVDFEFVADQQGEYIMLCGIPGHALGGQWIHFNVGGADAEATFEAHEPTQEGGAAGI